VTSAKFTEESGKPAFEGEKSQSRLDHEHNNSAHFPTANQKFMEQQQELLPTESSAG
jgi:hypothetical protein